MINKNIRTKTIPLLLATAALFAVLSACTPADAPGQDPESEILRWESSTEGASTDASPESDPPETASGTTPDAEGETDPEAVPETTPETERETEPPYTGSLPSDRGFRAEYIRNDGTGSYYGGAEPGDLTGMFTPYSNADWEHSNEDLVTPLYTILWNGYRDCNYFGVYDKLTGQTSLLCPDPDCTHEFCVWYQSPDFLYFGREHIYFLAGDWDRQSFFRCDHDRMAPEFLFSLNSYESFGNVAVFHEDGDLIYMTREIPDASGEYIPTYGVFDCTTWEFTPIHAEKDMYIETVTGGDTLWCRKYLDPNRSQYTLYRADIAFTEIETLPLLEKALKEDPLLYIRKITEDYVVVGRKGNNTASYGAVLLYKHKTDEIIRIPESITHFGFLTGVYTADYVYYTRDLTEEEWNDTPLEDYYEYETTYELEFPRPGHVETVTADKEGGRIYRMNLQTFEEECVLSLTYNDVPVKFHSFSMDGTVCYISYETYEEYWNYYHPEEDQHLPEHHIVVDFGTGEILLSDEDVIFD